MQNHPTFLSVAIAFELIFVETVLYTLDLLPAKPI